MRKNREKNDKIRENMQKKWENFQFFNHKFPKKGKKNVK